jgi:hypothetical protein
VTFWFLPKAVFAISQQVYNIFVKKTLYAFIILILFCVVTTVLLRENTKIFTSKKLGISFDYSTSPEHIADDFKIVTFEQGNKVYVSYNAFLNRNSPSGQSVEVFYKEPKESFYDAIKRIILKDYPFSGCKIVPATSPSPNLTNNDLEYAEITYPSWENPNVDNIDEAQADIDKCNSGYDNTEGWRYFAYNPKYPDRFFFFSIGQEEIMNAKEKPWQDTLKVLPLSQ